MKIRHGFTIVEILVVLAILTVLAGLLFPVFSRMRRSSLITNTMNNAHQNWIALSLYRSDWG